MDERKALIESMSGAKPKVRLRMESAVDAIIRLVWDYRSPEFSFLGNPDIDAEVNAILAAMSDGNKKDAEDAALRLLELLDYEEWTERSQEWAAREKDGQDVLFRLDMHASHLKELLEGWLVAAAILGLSVAVVKSQFFANLENPSVPPSWTKAGLGPIRWGRGYARNVLGGITVVVQDYINAAYQYAKVQRFREMGAIGYRTVRNSYYDCPLCDQMGKVVWPLNQVVLPYHPRCVCTPVPVFENENI